MRIIELSSAGGIVNNIDDEQRSYVCRNGNALFNALFIEPPRGGMFIEKYNVWSELQRSDL